MTSTRCRLRLYVCPGTPSAQLARENLERLRERDDVDWDLEVIDVLSRPEQAREDSVVFTPTLIKLAPLPERRLTGDLSDPERVRLALDLCPP